MTEDPDWLDWRKGMGLSGDELMDAVEPYGRLGPRCFDRAGNPISMRQWSELRETGGIDYIRVALTRISEYSELSTVWLGLDHQLGLRPDAPPLIFESMYFIEHEPRESEIIKGHVFDREGFLLDRYSTEEQALAGHDQLIEHCKNGTWKER